MSVLSVSVLLFLEFQTGFWDKMEKNGQKDKTDKADKTDKTDTNQE